MELTTSKPARSKLCLLHSFIATDLTSRCHRAKRFVSREHVAYVARHAYEVPDSRRCLRALELVRQCSPDFLVNHCLRSYAFGVAMAHKVDRDVDKEVLFLGSIMHDLGLTERFDGPDTFEVEGAKAARDFCIEHDVEASRADLVHEMVALHNSVGVAHKREPEIALLHYGAGVDVLGLWVNDIHRATLDEVISEFPRLDFKQGMASLIARQVERKPDSYMRTLVELGFLKNMQKAPFSS